MKQFFPELDLHESLKKTREKAKKTPTVRTPRAKVLDCSVCKLDKQCKTPRMKGSGNLNSKVMICGEAGGLQEDLQGMPFVGRSGKYLRRILNAVGVNDKDVYITNTCKCRPPDNQTPTSQQIQCCFPFLLEEINLIKPELIVLVGATPLEAMLGATEISKYHGFLIPSAKYNCILLPVFHPAAALRNEEAYTICMTEDLKKISTYVPINCYDLNHYDCNHYVLTEEKDIELLFKEASGKKFAAIDIETVNLKPFNHDSRILTFALAMNGQESYSFDITDNIPIPAIEKFFKSNCIKLIQNAKFELQWFKEKLGLNIDPDKIHDTMLFSYLLREVKGTHSLDFQSFVRLGLQKLEEIKPYKTKMNECPPELLHKYNGLDTKLTYRLHEILYPKIRKDKKLFNFYKEVLIRAAKATLKTETQGAPISLTHIDKLSEDYEKRIESIIKEIYSLPEVKKYRENNKFNLNSTPNIRDFLSETYKITDIKQTEKKQSSVDKEVLAKFAPTNRFCNSMLIYRDLVKANSTYLKGMRKNIWDDGKIHTNFNLHVTETGRLGSDGPNLQNIDKHKHPELRSIFVPPKNHLLLSADYTATEVRGVAMLSKDEELKRIILDNIDMHGYWAQKIFKVETSHPDFKELYRYRAKNKFVFPLIYGSSVKSVAESLGIPYEEADYHFKEFFKELSGLRSWQLAIKAFYMKNGYVETPFGRKRRAPLTHNQIINTPIQSIMSDFTLLSMVRLSEERDYWIMATIHDDLTFIIHENKIEEAYHDIRHMMTDYDYEWMNGIPLGVDFSIGPNWGKMEEFKL